MLPILYSFRRCPYAIRSRMAIYYSQMKVELREVQLKNKPIELLTASPKGTVPVLVLTDNSVIDESRDIIQWALAKNDPDGWLDYHEDIVANVNQLIDRNDQEFKVHLDHYKYADRFPEHMPQYYRQQCETFLQQLESILSDSLYLYHSSVGIADIAIFPFIRQFAFVDKIWFYQSQYHAVQNWLDNLLTADLFLHVMHKYPCWKSGDEILVLNETSNRPINRSK